MIVTEIVVIDGVSYTLTRSDSNKIIEKVSTGERFYTALDPGTPPEYTETTEDIPAEPEMDL